MNKKIEKFEDLIVWQESVKLSIELFKELKQCKEYGLKDQMQRSAISIPSNIAEGFERKSNKEYIQFLHISLGSCAELRTQLYIADRVDLIEEPLSHSCIDSTKSISAMLRSLIETRKTKFK